VGLLAIGALIISGATEMHFSYREAIVQTQVLQAAQATAAVREIDQHLEELTAALSDITKSPWGARGFDPARRRADYRRVMVLYPSIAEVVVRDAAGHALLRLSHAEPDAIDADAWARQPSPADMPPDDAQAAPPLAARFGAPYFDNGSEPYVHVDLAGGRPWQGRVQATLHLRLVAEVLDRLDNVVDGQAYLVDSRGQLILHPEQTEMLAQRNLNARPAVVAARAALGAGSSRTATLDTQGLRGRDAIATATYSKKTGWLLFLEQPRATVLKPAFDTLRRTAALVALAALLTGLVSAWSGRRMARPVVALREASARIAGGDFDTPVVLKTGDELELLADDLNTMAGRLRGFYEELEERVASRTLELMQARDTAERASQAKTRFLAAASHDLRQPMHTIGLLVGVLANCLREADQLAIAGKLGTTVEAMERLFSSLLDISKLDAGAVQVTWETFPVQDLLDRLAQRFEMVANERGLQLRVHRCSAIVRSDPGLLERCLGNLVANALNYTPSGRVVVGCRRRGSALAIQVHDTGPGIAAEHQQLIFEEFIRLPGVDAVQARGLGLGLAIVRRTADLLEHRLALKSGPGLGSMFEMSLEQLPACMPPLPRANEAPYAGGEMQGVFALIIDDDEGNRAALQALCTRWGCHVAVASDAEAAMSELDRHLRAPDILLTDLKLNGLLDGLDLVGRLRAALEEATPCLLLTADTDASVLERARAMDVHVLHKPASPDRIYAAACTALRRRARNPGDSPVSA
jgi:signal transduction histidine kinase/CheY-like chemotaxis protein